MDLVYEMSSLESMATCDSCCGLLAFKRRLSVWDFRAQLANSNSKIMRLVEACSSLLLQQRIVVAELGQK